MQANPHSTATPAPTCPMHALAQDRGALREDDELVLPLHRRVVVQYAESEDGAAELRLYWGDKEISFDEPALFAFGERLAQQSRFVAGAATGWGAGYAWSSVRPLLEQLIEEGVLRRAEDADREPALPRDGARSSPLPAAPCAAPRSWADCEAITQQLAGRPLELSWLELVLPIFRVAHIALDADGRHVGEANVFPKALRTDVPTSWRQCIYAGTRHQSERPMNVSALKVMRQHWGTMMAALAQIRAAYLERFPQPVGPWAVGPLERLATAVLALPTYQLMRTDNPVANGALHPALASLFRVTDGLRMTLHQMLFVPVGEPTLAPGAPITSREIMAYAERNYSFHSEHGVCAGPQAMIEEFLAVLVDGQPPAGAAPGAFEPAVQQALDDMQPAFDYALLGLQAHAAVFTLWPVMARSYERLLAVAEDWAKHGLPVVEALRDRLRGHVAGMKHGSYLASEAWRADREAVYADMYAQCARGLGQADALPLPEQIAPVLSCAHGEADQRLATLLQRRLGRMNGTDAADVLRLRDAVMAFLLQQQAILRVAGRAQQRINALLGRPQAQRAFSAADLDIHNQLLGAVPGRLPYLNTELEDLLGAPIVVDALHIEIGHPDSSAPAACGAPPDSAGMVPADVRASSTQSTRRQS